MCVWCVWLRLAGATLRVREGGEHAEKVGCRLLINTMERRAAAGRLPAARYCASARRARAESKPGDGWQLLI